MALAGVVSPAAESGWYDDYAAAQHLYQPGSAAQRSKADLDVVVTLCRSALAKQPPERRLGEIQFLLGQACYDDKLSLDAVRALRAATAAEPKVGVYRLWLGYAYALDDRPTLAVRAFQAVAADPAADAASRQSAGQWLTTLHEPLGDDRLLPSARLVVPGVVLRYWPREAAAAQVRQALTTARQLLFERVGIDPEDPVEVVLFRDAAEYQQFHQQRQTPRPEWSTACTMNGRIYCYATSGNVDALAVTLTHEYTHVALRAYAEDRTLPCWLDEGLAVLFSGEFPAYREELAAAPRWLSLKALLVPSFGVYERADARLAYIQSKAMAETLLKVQGPIRLRAYLRALGQGVPDDVAFEQTLQLTLQAFYDNWTAGWSDGR